MTHKAPRKPQYKVVIEVLGKKWTREASSIEKALNSFNLSWETVNGKGHITVSKGDEKYTKLYGAVRLRRIFSHKLIRMMEAKYLTTLLSEDK